MCVSTSVTVRRARLREKKSYQFSLEQINTAPNDAYAVSSTETTKKDLEYVSVPDTTDISTSTNAAYLSTRSETEPHDVYDYAVVPDRGEQKLKQNVAYVPTNIPAVANAAYVATGELKDVPEDYDYVINHLK